MHPFNETSYVNQTFNHLTIEDERIEHIEFQNCQFKQCKFSDVLFSKVRFMDCDFESCDLFLCKFPGCKFSEVAFKDSKVVGINWTELSWPLVKLNSPIYFYRSNISHSSFYNLQLADLIIEECKAHDVDFREANLSHARFNATDLRNSLFMYTNLKSADFSNAINYSIDPTANTITQARFSFPEVTNMLFYFKITIDNWPGEE